MRFLKSLISISALLLTIGVQSSCFANTVIKADNSHFHFTGRIDFSNPQQPYLSWPGTSIKFRMTGNKLAITLNDDKGLNFYNVIFNGQNDYPYVLSAKTGKHVYDLSHMLETEETEVEIFKRTEGAEGGTNFLGLELADNSKLVPLADSNTRKISFYGDSITVGMGNEAPHNLADDKAVEKNHYLSYAAITARALDADFHSIAKSGIGFIISWFDFIMPEYYDQITAENNNDSQWNFSQWQPDVVVVNLGQNDSWIIDDQKRIEATPSQITQHYKTFIETLRALHPNAFFICAIGSMDATENQIWPSYIEQAVAQIKHDALKQGEQAKIDTLQFKFTGYGAHPRVEQHVKNARTLTQLIKQNLNW
ncbi:SGNH/GDSL hydrolase family protein [Paraglaciecola sp.]|uniref:SGNH/GDSL hydrolase family protein n=1 Tax=Paraglaciecola sp. TaxID=1920173 RepID=UPI003EF47C33